MSRIGNKPVAVPGDVKVAVSGRKVSVEGPKGKLQWEHRPEIEVKFDDGAQRGKSVEVTATGTFERWPVRGWVEGSGVEVRPGKAKGKLSVQVAANAEPGVRCQARAELRVECAASPEASNALRGLLVRFASDRLRDEGRRILGR